MGGFDWTKNPRLLELHTWVEAEVSPSERPILATYTDSSYAPDGDRSHGGAVTFWGTCPIAWRSSRQTLVTTSSAETELVAAHHGCQQMESVDALLSDVGGAAATADYLRGQRCSDHPCDFGGWELENASPKGKASGLTSAS